MISHWEYSPESQFSLLEQIIRNRNLTESFFNGSLSDLAKIPALQDIDLATDRIIEAIQKKQRIMIFGHDDVDGITSTYILFSFLEKMGSQNHYYYIPNRMTDDHGLQPKFIKKVKEKAIDLVITVDGGISCFDAVKEIQQNICDIIITDHHIVQNRLPEAFAVVNPKRHDDNFPDKMIAGVGVTYFLLKNLTEKLSITLDKNFLFWTAAGTIADKVPLLKINRIFVKEVLENWFVFDAENIKKLCSFFGNSYSYYKRIHTIHMINRLLSNGRRENGENLALSFLLSINKEQESISEQLFSEMRNFEAALFDVKSYLSELIKTPPQISFVHYDAENKIPLEFLGLAAGRVAKTYRVPAVFLKDRNGTLMAEARSSEGFDLVKAFHCCQENLIQYGGHAKAAGFSMKKNELAGFVQKFTEYAETQKEKIKKNRKIVIDAVLEIENLHELDDYIKIDYNLLQPFGQKNPNPKIMIKHYLPSKDRSKIKINPNDHHLQDNISYDLIVKFQGNTFDLIDLRKNLESRE